jgi:hypothetical protein
MTRRTPIFIVCSPHARAGVTTTARLLTDYYLAKQNEVVGFDLDPHEPRYAELFRDRTKVVDIASIQGQIALFDRLLTSEEKPRVIDVWHRSFERFFSAVREIGFFEETAKTNLEPIVLFHADASKHVLTSALALSALWPTLRMVIVHNRAAAPFETRPFDVLSRYPSRRRLVIPPLADPVAKALEDDRLSLSGFLTAPPSDMSIVVRAALRDWIISIFTQLNSLELRLEFEHSDVFR